MTVPRTAARVLAACARARSLGSEIDIHDPVAERAFRHLGGSFAEFGPSELFCAAFRAHVIDRLALEFFARAPDALGVGVGSCLGTRAYRLSDVRWTDVDTCELLRLRRHLMPERAGYTRLSACACASGWLDAVCGRNEPLFLVLDEGALPICAGALTKFLDDVSRRVKDGSELVLAFDGRSGLALAERRGAGTTLELRSAAVHSAQIVRYPRLRSVDPRTYARDLAVSFSGVNVMADVGTGGGSPWLLHLRLV